MSAHEVGCGVVGVVTVGTVRTHVRSCLCASVNATCGKFMLGRALSRSEASSMGVEGMRLKSTHIDAPHQP